MNILLLSVFIGFSLMAIAFVFEVAAKLDNDRHTILPEIFGGLGLLFWSWPLAYVLLTFGVEK